MAVSFRADDTFGRDTDVLLTWPERLSTIGR
jgi:hypothetical protein